MLQNKNCLFINKKNRLQIKNAFGLIEVLVSAAILMIVIGSVLSLGRISLRSSVESTERTQAYNLAREGLEIARSVRDTSLIDGIANNDWNSEENNYFSACLSQAECYFTKDGNGLWQSVAGSEEITTTEFSRSYYLESLAQTEIDELNIIVDPDETNEYDLGLNIRKVKVIVSWGNDQSVEVSEVLTNWKPEV